MKIAFFGTPAFTTDFLDKLVAAGYAPTLIVTSPDRPVGRGMKLTSPAPKAWAQAHGVNVLQPEKLDGAFFTELSKIPWDVFIVVAYGKIMPEHIITIPKHGTINVHYSLLPKYRGATPVESAILNGDSLTGISIQQMRFKLDSGPILKEKEVVIDSDDTAVSLREKLNAEALLMVPEVLRDIESGTVHAQEQDESRATHCGKIKKEDGRLDLTDDPLINYNKYRAYYGSIGTYFFKDDKRVKITKAHLGDETFVIDEVIPENGKRVKFENT